MTEDEAWIEDLKDAIDTIAVAYLAVPRRERERFWMGHRQLVESRARSIAAEDAAE